ncbi:polysaccharide pyruvyl transferase family protein [Shewanella mangrovisoli]|uniref:polysaccharide pyruvyl transferase family protein n=1 Tax=Shewanella mangrovisoli TaxID=2864211 RepID=UPI003709FA0D
MKVATFTLPFHPNYGATLQAYALQQSLIELGHETAAIDVERKALRSLVRHYLSRFKSFLLGGDFRENYNYGNLEFHKFIKNEIITTRKITFPYQFRRKDINSFDAYIVGSDQVWRPKYVENIQRYFFDFVSNDKIKISYAASFGTGSFEFLEEDAAHCKSLINEFKAVSVREESGVDICCNYFKYPKPQLVLDPTFLIEVNKYNDLIDKYSNSKPNSDCFCYILDPNEYKISKIKNSFIEAKILNLGVDTKNKVGIGCWLKGIRDSEYVVTDSFHGVVFSIIFNKKFVAIGNRSRGLARFENILNLFGIPERLVTEEALESINLKEVLDKEIDYTQVNNILLEQRLNSFQFLKNSLK